MKHRSVAAAFALIAFWSVAKAEEVPALDALKSQADLDKAMASLDAALFDAYNTCDLPKFASFFADDVEFYHDQGGVTLGKEKLTDSIRKSVCGTDVRRDLVPGTLEAHRMKGYGAIQIGVHRFSHPKSKTGPSEARFVHLWRYVDGAWKITRVLSFDHHEL